jgi:hypothetical protein
MQRRPKLLVLFATLALIAVAVTAWLVWFPPWATALEKRLLGTWEGTGTISGESTLEVKPDPAKGIPGGKWSGKVTSACTVRAEFKPDGTYTWNEQQQGQGASKGMNFNFWVPKKDGDPARWAVVRAQGSKLTIRIHLGEVVFDFQGEDAFTMGLPESTKARGTYTFRRSGISKE